MTMEERRHELLADTAQQTEELLKLYGIDESIADQVGCAVADHLANHWGGQLINIPKDYQYKLANRDLEIWNDFTGSNHAQLAKKYKLSTRAIYKIIKRVKERQSAADQPGLFDVS
ncbi:Mor transcription activator family protein [Oceanospirillum beijerinckii]|uniref:Mor transcription activator family protein n=1 Tax=Oceanospirillum beijerinckii TaxID=64976 RepID=UPI0004135D15|nr:Mor transcription activator family protein [Oceanospirillum beijerinckii]